MTTKDLIGAIDKQDLEEVERLLADGADVNAAYRQGRTPLHFAVVPLDAPPSADIVRLLIEGGANVNAHDQGQQWTALHIAARDQRYQIVEMLVDAGAKIDSVDIFGNTPLGRCVFNQSPSVEIIELLLAKRADPKKANKSGVSPLDLAETTSKDDVVALLS